MGHNLSKGIRIYEHAGGRICVGRDAYNFYQGMNELDALKIDPSVEIFGVGSEGGAMVVHFRWIH